jgi:PAS domain S-box-containing protein
VVASAVPPSRRPAPLAPPEGGSEDAAIDALALSVFVVSAGTLAWCMRARALASPPALWLCGWSFLLLSGLSLQGEPGRVTALAQFGGTLFPALLLAGALAHQERRIPPWLLPAAVAIGVARTGLAAGGQTALAFGSGIPLEPAAEIAAAWVLLPLTRRDGASYAQRALAPLFLAVAVLDTASSVSALLGDPLPPLILWSWALVTPPVLAAQIGAAAQRRIEEEETQRGELERRVAERTEQLAAANRSLEAEVAGRERAEVELRASRYRYQLVSEISSDLSFAFRVAPDGTLSHEWVTDAFTRMTGFTRAEFVSQPWDRLLHPEDVESVKAWQQAALRGERSEFDARIVRKDGEVRWLHTTLAGVRDPEEGVLRIVGATRDVTERKKAEEERRSLESHVREMQRLESLGVLAGGLAHDFNNVLSVILGNTALVQADFSEDSTVQRRLERVRAAAQHAAGLTDQMLTYSGNASVSLKPLDLSRLVDGVRDLLEASMLRRSRLELRLDAPTLVDGDETQLRQVVVNLVSNASEAMGGRPGAVWVRTGTLHADRSYLADTFGHQDLEPGEYAYVEVSDPGEGIGEAAGARIFEPFYTTKVSGRGLGLAAVLGIVQGHHGAIKVTSEPGRGTTFRVLLPSSLHVESAQPEEPEQQAARNARGVVLVVDDDEPVLELAHEFLARAGFEVHSARGGREALRIAAERPIDAVVLDVIMPDMEGEDVLRSLRAARPDVPVVLVTGFGDDATLRRFEAAGVTAVLRKPYEAEALIDQVSAAIGG